MYGAIVVPGMPDAAASRALLSSADGGLAIALTSASMRSGSSRRNAGAAPYAVRRSMPSTSSAPVIRATYSAIP